MSENVVSLKGGSLNQERRDQFAKAVAISFDRYVEEYGSEPDALVYVLCGIRQPSHIAWDVQGDSKGGVTSVLSIAAMHCAAEAQSARQGLPQ